MATIIKIKTLMCPNGLNNVNSSCRFHRAFDQLPQDSKCPTCKLGLLVATDPTDQITVTVIDEAEVDNFVKQNNQIVHQETADMTDRVDTEMAAKKGIAVKLKARQELTAQEKQDLISKIRNDIAVNNSRSA